MSNSQLPTVLEDIVRTRRGHLEGIGTRIAHVDPATLPRSERSLFDALHGKRNAFIMECKSSSPSLGMIRAHYEPGTIARVYSRYAAAISVLCEPERFGGDYDHLATVAASTHLPVLCKDFIVDPVQVHAARYFGADAILLMLSVLDDAEYAALAAEAARLGMDVLTEVIDEEEVARALRLGAQIIGCNHRNLHDLSIDLTRSGRLAPLVPQDRVFIAESGVRDNATVRALGGHANGFLVGSQLTSQPDIDRAARELVFGANKVCGLTSPAAAQAARAAGAVYGGLVFEASSPRNVSRETAAEIIAHEPDLAYVAVTRRTAGWAELCQPGIAAIQVHAPYQGSLDAELTLLAQARAEIAAAGHADVNVWRAVDMTNPDAADPDTLAALADAADLLVLDSGAGGTGRAFDWSAVPGDIGQRALLAGGLNLGNLVDALGIGTRGLDLNSGFERPDAPGAKDSAALARAFALLRTYTAPNTSTSTNANTNPVAHTSTHPQN